MVSHSVVYISLYLFPFVFGRENKLSNDLSVNIKSIENKTFLLSYNLTSNYPYYLTFRLFQETQIKLGLYSPLHRYERKFLKIFYQHSNSKDSTYFIIICFHFIHHFYHIDVQCEDVRLIKQNQKTSQIEFLPTYKPLFIPMMYALSVLMLLPVLIQHRRRKRAKLKERRRQIRRLSITIAKNNPEILSSPENSNGDLKQIPIHIELLSLPKTNSFLDDIDDNDNIAFKLQTMKPLLSDFADGESSINADDCIAHLLDNTPWNSSISPQSPVMSRVKRIPFQTFLKHNNRKKKLFEHGNYDDLYGMKRTKGDTTKLFKSSPNLM